MLPYPLTSFEIQNHDQNKISLNGVYSRNKLPKIKDGAYVINLDEYESIGTHWTVLYVNGNHRKEPYYLIFLTALKLNIFQNKLKDS